MASKKKIDLTRVAGPCCGNCACWAGQPSDAAADCVRYPPRVFGVDIEDAEVMQDVPFTEREFRCFEHRYKTN